MPMAPIKNGFIDSWARGNAKKLYSEDHMNPLKTKFILQDCNPWKIIWEKVN